MRNFQEYNVFYGDASIRLGYLKIEGSYSIVKYDKDGYVEVIVDKDQLEGALHFPGANELTLAGKMEVLFGNMSGFENFIKFCDWEDIETRTFDWE